MNRKEKLKILNTIKLYEVSCSGDEMEYALSKNTSNIRSKMDKMGYGEEWINEHMKPLWEEEGTEEYIDISLFAWEIADYYKKGKWHLSEKGKFSRINN